MNRAKQLRIDAGIGLVEAAQGAGISPRTLKKIEAGAEVGAPALARLATFFEARPSELLAPAVFNTPEGEAA